MGTFFDNEFSLDKPNLKEKKNRKKETKRRIIGRPIERQLRLFIFSFLNCSCERPDFDYIYASDDEFEITAKKKKEQTEKKKEKKKKEERRKKKEERRKKKE